MKKILIVDDMAIFCEPVAMALEKQGYKTACANCGREAIEATLRERPDLILLDMVMPDMNGIEVLRKLRTMDGSINVPVIMLTDTQDKSLIVQAAQLNVCGWVLKSEFSLKNLLQRISGVFKQCSLIDKGPAQTPDVPGDVKGDNPPSVTRSTSSDGETTEPVKIEQVQSAATGDSLREMKSLMRRSEVNEALDDCGELKGMSPTVAQVLKLTQQKDASIDAISKVVKQDHAISLKILKLANSSIYTRGEYVDTVHKAVMRIGLSQIHQTVLNIGVVEKFSAIEDNEQLNSALFWEHSIATGLIASEITRSLEGKEVEIDTAFTMGLLHDVGRLVYAEMFGDKYIQVLDCAQRLKLPVEQVESRLLLVNHADAMDRILHAWHFPKALIDPIRYHHLSMGNIRRMVPRSLQEVATLALADRLAHALLLGSSGNLAIYPIEEYLTAFKLDENFIQRIEEEIPAHTADIKFAMLSRSNEQGWPEMKKILQGHMTQPFRPIFAGLDSKINAVRIFCDVLAEVPDEDEKPNIAVAVINHTRKCITVSAQLQNAEKQADVERLPLIIISPKGDLQLENQIMAGRKCYLMPLPFIPQRFIETVNTLSAVSENAA